MGAKNNLQGKYLFKKRETAMGVKNREHGQGREKERKAIHEAERR